MFNICLECHPAVILLMTFIINSMGAFIIYKVMYYFFETEEERDYRKFKG
jgi:hypothetical protein